VEIGTSVNDTGIMQILEASSDFSSIKAHTILRELLLLLKVEEELT